MKTKKIFLLLLLAVLLSFGVLTLSANKADWSPYENRFLAKPPAFSIEALLSGQTAKELEQWFADHIFRRESLLRLKTRLELLRGKAEVNGVVSTETALLPAPEKRELPDTAELLAERYRTVQDAVQSCGGAFLYVHVPEQRSVLRNAYPAWMHTEAEYLDAASDALLSALAQNGVSYLDMRGLLDESDYFATDHHYNILGADKTAAAICEQIGVRYESPAFAAAENPFLGTYGRKLFGVSPVKESLLLPVLTVPYTRFDNGAPSSVPLLDLPETGTAYYSTFMGGDVGETVLRTDRPELPDLLIVGDSFTNPAETLLYASFDETRSLDLRHYSEKSLTEYLREYHPDAVIVLRDDVSCLDPTGNGELS